MLSELMFRLYIFMSCDHGTKSCLLRLRSCEFSFKFLTFKNSKYSSPFAGVGLVVLIPVSSLSAEIMRPTAHALTLATEVDGWSVRLNLTGTSLTPPELAQS